MLWMVAVPGRSLLLLQVLGFMMDNVVNPTINLPPVYSNIENGLLLGLPHYLPHYTYSMCIFTY